VAKSPHYGIDYAAPTGTPVLAPAAGVITMVHENMFYSGGTLILDHGHGLSSTFLHLSEILVEEGQRVASGSVIAKIGASGRATGPHLDWRMNWLDQRIDPQLVLETLPIN
jgi:murein DD-endopeptidase MepM/ murein hydrolase activator NlpD